MRLTRLYLRNYRVYEDELDLELPAGLLGIYGVNGAGKSALLESILWTLWGRARTSKEEIRTAGVARDCVTEVEFEHEGHLYLVRRALTGANATVKAEAHCDGLLLSEGVRDTGRYVHQVLGMDDGAFRASVFAEQKQLSAFSSQSPAERRKLILQLLGITPLDSARDTARKDARARRDEFERLRGMLADLDALGVAVEDAEAKAAAAETLAADEETAAEAAWQRAETLTAAFAELDLVRQRYETLVVQGKAARSKLDGAVKAVADLTAELAELDGAATRLAELEPEAEGAATAEELLRLVQAFQGARQAAEALQVPPEPPVPDEGAHAVSVAAAEQARAAVADIDGQLKAVKAELTRARQQAERSSQLSGEADCPLCGQALGDAFEQVQAHRAGEVADAAARLEALQRGQAEVVKAERTAAAELVAARKALDAATEARRRWEQAVQQRAQLDAGLDAARRQLVALPDGEALTVELDGLSTAQVAALVADLTAQVKRRREAAAAAERLRGRLERRPSVLSQLDVARDRAAEGELEVGNLLDEVKALGFDREALEESARVRKRAAEEAEAARGRAQKARLLAAQERARAEGEAKRLADAREQHARLAALETEARHLSRLADLLNAFRNTVVAAVGPRLAVQAAELFGELTDHEYDQLEVDPESYQLQIRDAGRLYGMERFSGSEVDLANLALRVAISEHVRFQSGGTVGLLVLDEVFGPLDEERKARTLLALERLRGRFRQVLVVTHDSEIKEQLPGAIEVIKRPGRRATARLLAG